MFAVVLWVVFCSLVEGQRVADIKSYFSKVLAAGLKLGPIVVSLQSSNLEYCSVLWVTPLYAHFSPSVVTITV